MAPDFDPLVRDLKFQAEELGLLLLRVVVQEDELCCVLKVPEEFDSCVSEALPGVIESALHVGTASKYNNRFFLKIPIEEGDRNTAQLGMRFALQTAAMKISQLHSDPFSVLGVSTNPGSPALPITTAGVDVIRAGVSYPDVAEAVASWSPPSDSAMPILISFSLQGSYTREDLQSLEEELHQLYAPLVSFVGQEYKGLWIISMMIVPEVELMKLGPRTVRERIGDLREAIDVLDGPVGARLQRFIEEHQDPGF